MSFRQLDVSTSSRCEMIDVTAQVVEVVRDSGVTSGRVVCYVPHTTAGVTIQENADPDVTRDLTAYLSKLVPRSAGFRHAEGNSDAHIKASLVGSSVTVLVRDGRCVLGTWQAIYFCEFDGPRQRTLIVQTAGGD